MKSSTTRTIVVALALFSLVALLPRLAEATGLISAMQAQHSVVNVRAESSVVFDGGQQAVKHPTRGLVVMKSARPVYFKRDGAGIILTKWGLIVTNAHTVHKAGRVKVALEDKTIYEAKVEKVFLESDLAFLRISPEAPVPAIKLANSNEVKLRNEVFSIGNSKFFNNTVSGGTVNGIGVSRRRDKASPLVVGLIEINFNTYHGDSGTPILDQRGDLLGIVMGGNVRTRTTYAIPVNTIKVHLQEIVAEKSGGAPTSGPETT